MLDGVKAEAPPGRFIIAQSSAGSAFPSKPFTFTVHSIFRSALNLRITTNHSLISLVADPRYAHPRGTVVPCARFDEWSLERGVTGKFNENCISFSTAGSPRVLIGSSRRDAEERSPAIVYSTGLVRGLDRAYALAAAGRRERGSAPIFAGTELGSNLEAFTVCLRASAAELVAAFDALSPTRAIRAAARIVGLGSGLTPTGDDFLCGFLAARRSLGQRDDRELRFLDDFGRALGDLLRETNDISASFLASAAEGRFSAALVDLANAMRAEASVPVGAARTLVSTYDVATGVDAEAVDELPDAVATLCSIGHGSGLDAAEGFLYGLKTGKGSRYGDET